mmetsp:Transcript_1142/g.2909  ORF Transcript_1142/g.2909 Transcript_1142/m.2909 type:complete len:571 (-) Transcript_1142:395-2107(-)|eukprot:CAMPEP_0172362164 /NCGR_PEP_ID=MMETSP1060-20121228/5844_1 /TAXON_ID=37318 /ORGANISM="Pseudo-nitzschia pungens, Strain cf. cingulata" /LENGTH=570 /DNA_ID=CAMNT_0013084611 /DNA_START=143 /DNA_END=1855 /DNA_ORIENTATION=+
MGSNGQDNTALSGFLNELLSEQRAGMSSDDDDLSCGYGSSDSDSVSLSSDEETSYYRKKAKTPSSKYGNAPPKTSSHKTAMMTSSHHRRLRQRRSRSRCRQQQQLHSSSHHLHSQSHHSSQRPTVKFAVTQDNARVARSRSSPLYHSAHNATSVMPESSAHSYSLSTSMHSLGSRNSITNTSINNWRSSQHHHHHIPRHSAAGNRQPRDSRWSGSLHKTRSFDLPDSLHKTRMVQSAARHSIGKQHKHGSGHPTYSHGHKKPIGSMSTAATIDSAVALFGGSSDDDDFADDVEEFYGDEDSVSAYSLLSFATSSTFNSSISSMCWNSRPRQQHRGNNPFANPRDHQHPNLGTTATNNPGSIPKMPQRTTDQPSSRKILQRSLSDDGTWLSNSQASGNHNDFVLRRTKKRGAILRSKSSSEAQVGRWAAMITRDTTAVTDLHRFLAPPRRVPSGSGHGVSQHSNQDDAEYVDNGASSEDSYGGHDSGSYLASPSAANVSQAEPLFYSSSARSFKDDLSMLFVPTRQPSNRELVGDSSYREDPAMVSADEASSDESRNFGSTHRSEHTAMEL